jgi:UDP-N-acetylmuramate--alanine ligase
MVGIKGTGMTALAEILAARGAILSGSDRPETFYTDAILQALKIPVAETFSPANIAPGVRLVIHSAAYSPAENPELQAALRAGLPVLSYPQALGQLSARYDAAGICGTHGKTTTTALAGSLAQALGLPATVLAGSQIGGFGDRCTLVLGLRYLIAETCEYRRHFLHFHPRRIVLTNVEPDHLDYYSGQEDLLAAFTEYADRLPSGGALIHNADDPGAAAVVERIGRRRPDLRLLPFGERASGPFRIVSVETVEGETSFRLADLPQRFALRLPGRHSAWNAAAAVALAADILAGEGRPVLSPGDPAGEGFAGVVRRALAGFQGIRRRSEVLGERGGILFLDDYGHHPTEIRRTLEGLRAFYPRRRLIVDFMSHTYTRTRALLADFAHAFQPADEVILHEIYASAREERTPDISGEVLQQAVARHHPAVRYFAGPLDALPYLAGRLQAGDLFVTMGAGDNWKLGQELFRRLSGEKR